MFNADDLLKLIKRTALDAVNASRPANVVFGKVISISPLKVHVDQKLVLTSAQLVLSRNVTDHTVKIGSDNYTVYNSLKVGEQVILMQSAGGQKYTIIDRIGKG